MLTHWDELTGHDNQKIMFQRALQRNRLAHAFLFCGPPGIGKRTFANLLATTLLCEERQAADVNPCGECASCLLIKNGNHPDLLSLSLPEGKSEFPIELFVGKGEKRGQEGLCHELSLSSMRGRGRIAIIDDAETFSIASANALLKTLEEPAPGSTLILIATDPEQILPTIRSRCQLIYFDSLTQDQVRQILQSQGVSNSEAQLQSAIERSMGSVSMALELLENVSPLSWQALVNLLNQIEFSAVKILREIDQQLSEIGKDLHLQRQAAKQIIEECLFHYRRQLQNGASESASNLAEDDYCASIERCLKAWEEIEHKATVSLCLESLILDLERIQRHALHDSVGSS